MHTDISWGRKTWLAALLGLMSALLTPSVAMAFDSPMGAVLCTILFFVLGDMGRALATLAIIVVGVGASVGKASWGLAITVAVGIATIFGSIWLAAVLAEQPLICGINPFA